MLSLFYVNNQLYVDKNCPGWGRGKELQESQINKIIELRKIWIEDFNKKIGNQTMEKLFSFLFVSNMKNKTRIREKENG